MKMDRYLLKSFGSSRARCEMYTKSPLCPHPLDCWVHIESPCTGCGGPTLKSAVSPWELTTEFELGAQVSGQLWGSRIVTDPQ